LRPVSLPLAAFLYATFVVPGWLGERLGWRALSGLPLDTYRGFPLRSLWLDTFDRLSAPIENRYTIDDVAPWFATAGLELETWRSQAGLYILGRRSAL
jgi:hypothetical protein